MKIPVHEINHAPRTRFMHVKERIQWKHVPEKYPYETVQTCWIPVRTLGFKVTRYKSYKKTGKGHQLGNELQSLDSSMKVREEKVLPNFKPTPYLEGTEN